MLFVCCCKCCLFVIANVEKNTIFVFAYKIVNYDLILQILNHESDK